MGKESLYCGIIGLIVSFFGTIGLVVFLVALGPGAIILGVIAWVKDKDRKGLAGMIIGIMGLTGWGAFISLYGNPFLLKI